MHQDCFETFVVQKTHGSVDSGFVYKQKCYLELITEQDGQVQIRPVFGLLRMILRYASVDVFQRRIFRGLRRFGQSPEELARIVQEEYARFRWRGIRPEWPLFYSTEDPERMQIYHILRSST